MECNAMKNILLERFCGWIFILGENRLEKIVLGKLMPENVPSKIPAV